MIEAPVDESESKPFGLQTRLLISRCRISLGEEAVGAWADSGSQGVGASLLSDYLFFELGEERRESDEEEEEGG